MLAFKSSEEIVRMLLSKGAQVDLKDKVINITISINRLIHWKMGHFHVIIKKNLKEGGGGKQVKSIQWIKTFHVL